MNKVSDVEEPIFYSIHCIPEARLIKFRRAYRIGPTNISFYPANPALPATISNPQFTYLDQLTNAINIIHNNLSMLSSTVNMMIAYSQRDNNDMTIYRQHCSLSVTDSTFISWANAIDFVVFTTIEKAKTFLVDVMRMENVLVYREHFIGGGRTFDPSELEIVSLTFDDVLQMSENQVVAVNPYVPAFFN